MRVHLIISFHIRVLFYSWWINSIKTLLPIRAIWVTTVMFFDWSKMLNNRIVNDSLRNNYTNCHKLSSHGLKKLNIKMTTKILFRELQLLHQGTNYFENFAILLSSDAEQYYPHQKFGYFNAFWVFAKHCILTTMFSF